MNTEQLRWALASKNEDGSYVLPDRVRVPCKWDNATDLPCVGGVLYYRGSPTTVKHSLCHGLGYVPATDPMVWLEVLVGLSYSVCISRAGTLWYVTLYDDASLYWTYVNHKGSTLLDSLVNVVELVYRDRLEVKK